MNKAIAVLLGALTLSACGGTTVVHVNTNPQVRKDEQQAQKKVDGCLPQLKGGKKAFENCLVPKGEQAKAENCAIAAVKKDGVIGKKHRQQLTQDLVECGIK